MAQIQLKNTIGMEETLTSDWNLRASADKWQEFREEIQKSVPRAIEIMNEWRVDMTERYTKWERLIYKAAIKTIGRTTFRPNKPRKPSREIERLRRERTECKKEFERETDFLR